MTSEPTPDLWQRAEDLRIELLTKSQGLGHFSGDAYLLLTAKMGVAVEAVLGSLPQIQSFSDESGYPTEVAGNNGEALKEAFQALFLAHFCGDYSFHKALTEEVIRPASSGHATDYTPRLEEAWAAQRSNVGKARALLMEILAALGVQEPEQLAKTCADTIASEAREFADRELLKARLSSLRDPNTPERRR